MALTNKQRRFVDEYLIDLNATQAAIRAGYSKKTAEKIGSENLRKPEVAAGLQERMKAREQRTEITQDMVLREYAKLAFLDPRRFYDEGGALIPIQSLPADVAAALAGMEITVARSGTDEDGKPEYEDVKKIKFIDKKGALDSIARHLGMFTDKTEHSGPNGGPIETKTTVDASKLTIDQLRALSSIAIHGG